MPDILSKNAGGVLEITLNRPEHGNGATDAMAAELTRSSATPARTRAASCCAAPAAISASAAR